MFYSGLVVRYRLKTQSSPSFTEHPIVMRKPCSAFPLALGSFWGLVPAFLLIPLLIVRTVIEDRTLRAELPGYREYTQRVRYRLVPGVW